MIGVVGEGATADRVIRRLRDAGETVLNDEVDRVVGADPAAVVAVGEAALVALVWAELDRPILAVDIGQGLPSVPAAEAPVAVKRLADDEVQTQSHRLLTVSVDGEPVGPAALDAMLVRSEPGRISEYGVTAAGTRARFRADGVVAATPAGSHGYARAAGGPQLALDTDGVAVVPVAPFGLGAPSWVFDPADDIVLTVERDEGEVSVLLDGRERRRLAGRFTMNLVAGGLLRTVVPADR